MIPLDCFQKNKYVINLTTYDMISKFEAFKNSKLDTFYLTEITGTKWVQMIDQYWNEESTPYSSTFDFCP